MIQQQRKRQAVRAFTGLAGRFLPEPAEPAPPTPTPIAASRKPGRPRQYASDTARQAAHRARKSDPERRALVVSILKKCWTVLHTRDHRRKLRTDLLSLSLADLRSYLKVLKENLDLRGRLHNERSGERDRDDGISEIEFLLSLREQREHGARVSPEFPSILTSPKNDEARDAIIRDLLNEIADDQKCPFCDTKFETRGALENHLDDEYFKGRRQAEHVSMLRALSIVPTELLEDAERRLSEQTHFLEINKRAQCLRKLNAKLQRAGKKILDESGTYSPWDTRIIGGVS